MRHASPLLHRSPLLPVRARPALPLLLALLFLPTLGWARSAEQHRRPDSRAINLDQVRSGELLWNSERGLIPLPLADVEVELSIAGMMSHGRLTQRFRNPTDETIEAIFAFPLPDRSAVHHMEMQIGDRRIVSTIREREEARRTYERAKQTGRKASLLDQHRPNLFTTSVANINPGETIVVMLEYFEEVDYQQGRFSLRFPLAFVPRFVPPSSNDPEAPDAGALDGSAPTAVRGDLPLASIRVLLRPGFELDVVTSDSHAIRFSQEGDALRVDTQPRNVIADRDFLLSWSPERGQDPRWSVLVEERDGQRYALLMVLPPVPDSPTGLGLPTETLFIVDVSGSMAGPSIEQARAALLAALDRLRPDDRFNILAFNQDHVTFDSEFRQAESAPLEEARHWVIGLRATGGTMIYPALMRGLQLMGESGSAHAQRIVFLTDGAVANEQEVLRALAERLGDVRLHTIGIGQAPNAHLMRKMARFGHGLCEFVASTAQADNRIAAFLERIDRPVMEQIELNLREAGLEEVYPRIVPDLYAGEPLLLSAKLGPSDRTGALKMGGYTRDGWRSTTISLVDSVPRDSGIALRWARSRVDGLMDSLHAGADPRAVRAEVVDLALGFHLVTRYTSLVAVEEMPTALGDARTTRMAAALPTGGTDRPLKLRVGLILAALGLAALVALRVLR